MVARRVFDAVLLLEPFNKLRVLVDLFSDLHQPSG